MSPTWNPIKIVLFLAQGTIHTMSFEISLQKSNLAKKESAINYIYQTEGCFNQVSANMGLVVLGRGEDNSTTFLIHILNDSSQVILLFSGLNPKIISFPTIETMKQWLWLWNRETQVNVERAMVYLYANISFTVVTFVINLWAGFSILKKERTRIHDLIVCDCVVNVVSSLHNSFLQSPWSMLGSSAPCLLSIFFVHLTIAWNRLEPNTQNKQNPNTGFFKNSDLKLKSVPKSLFTLAHVVWNQIFKPVPSGH